MMRGADRLGLGQEQVERGHRDDADREALSGQELLGRQRDLDLASPRRRSWRGPCRRPATARRRRSAERLLAPPSLRTCGRFWRVSASRRRAVRALERELPAFGGLDRVGRAEDAHVRHGAQRRQVLDRLVGRAVLAEADGIVGHHVDDRNAGERRDAHGGAGIIGEDQEGRAGRHEAAMQRDAVHGRRHAVLADAVMDVAARVVAGRDGGRGSWSWCCWTASGRPSRAPVPASPR